VESLGRFRIYMTRYEVFPGWDAWTLVPVAFCLFALVAAFVYYGWSLYRESKQPGGINWDRQLGSRRWPRQSTPDLDPRDKLIARLKLGGISALTLYLGVEALVTGHVSGSHHGVRYSADGTPALVSGAMLCLGGLLMGIIAVFMGSPWLDRSWGSRDRGRLP
jgi:hypothetical protein